MEIFQNYRKYKEHKPEYKDWKEKRDLAEAKRLEYLKSLPPDGLSKSEDIKRGKTLLRAIDVMDEYSQTKAEDTEVATDMVLGQVTGLCSMLGASAGVGVMMIPAVRKRLGAYAQKNKNIQFVVTFLPPLIGGILALIPVAPLSAWAAKTQVKASRQGRFEAMKKDLSDPAKFALLNDEQTKEAEQIAAKMPDKKEGKKIFKDIKGPLKMFKAMFSQDKQFEVDKIEFDKKLKEHENNFDKTLNKEQLLKAQKDKQLLGKLVEKIDIASQDYAENIELATNTLTTAGLAGGLLLGWITNKLMKLLKVGAGKGKENLVSGAVTLVVTLAVSIYAAKIQKQGSRVGRFNVKQELLNNPENLLYAEDEKAAQLKDVKVPEKAKKPNFFKFLIQAFKDNKIYNKYLKTKNKEEKKFEEALKQIKLSDKQISDAKILQRNTFKTFNKVDEKSQTYAESVEAVGEIFKQPVALIGELGGMALAMLITLKSKKNTSELEKIQRLTMNMLKGALIGVLPAIGLDIYITKEQKKASRIADMLALKELDDVRHYADYESLNTPNEVASSPSENKTTFDKFFVIK